jgi:hypothetical protein
MDYKKFRNTLKEKGINLFDPEYRVSYNNILNLYEITEKDNQYKCPFTIIQSGGNDDIINLLNYINKNDYYNAKNILK